MPDNVLTPLINAPVDPFFTAFVTTREEEAVGIVTGAWMGGMRGIVLMQTSGFATLPNALASLAVPYQIPLLMIVSERGTLGEFNLGQAMVCRTMRPVLRRARDRASHDHAPRRARVHRRSLDQAGNRDAAPGALILSPLLTGGKTYASRERADDAHRLTPPTTRMKVMNRFDLSKRLVAMLRGEAVIGGIGNTNFDLWAAGHRPQNFYMLGSMGLACPDRARRRAGAAEAERVAHRGRRLAAHAARLPRHGRDARAANLAIVVMDNGCYQITGGQPTATAVGRPRRDRPRLRHRAKRTGRRTRRFREPGSSAA